MKTLPIAIPKEKIEQFCQCHYIRKLSLFGSVLRDDFTPEIDVDFLVEFDPGKTPGLFNRTYAPRPKKLGFLRKSFAVRISAQCQTRHPAIP
ncbi:MAG: hypothetical protein HC789_16810 [Microcoleus sp. CSU_2_2]|nr:hypothetical protein [Microcoleus sp. CSU_2_2]